MTVNPPQHSLLRALTALRREGIAYCVLRDGDRLDGLDGVAEVDLLIDKKQLAASKEVFERLGIRHVPAWGHSPHHFFVAYLPEHDGWIKLDVVTSVAFGVSSHALVTRLADNCLANRRRCGPVDIPSVEDEFVTLLLHCVLDKGSFAPHRRHRLERLRQEVADEKYLSCLLREYWSETADWPAIADRVDNAQWDSLLGESRAVAAYLENRQRIRVAGRRIRDSFLRKAQKAAAMVRPRAFSVAFLAPDGAGKSTLIASLEKSFFVSTRSIYMGIYPRREDSLKRTPLPGLGMLSRLIGQWTGWLKGRYHRGRGRLVLFDRYCYDACLPRAQPLVWWKRCHRWLLGHACPSPDLVVVLDAPGDVLVARKGEHTPALLEQRRQAYLAMAAEHPCAVTVDATQSPEQVCREVTSMLWRYYVRRLRRPIQGCRTGAFMAPREGP